MTQVKFGQEARDGIMQGVDTLAEAVATTLGPRGRNVGIDRGFETVILHDGVSVAEAIDLRDKWANFGVRVLREAAQRQVKAVGDGTTVTTILAQAILQECNKQISAGVNPMSLRKGLEDSAKLLVDTLREQAIPVATLDQKIQIATISAEDEDLGKLIGETLHEVGADGIVTIEESKGGETEVEHQTGMQFDQGYAHWQLITDPQAMEATVEDAQVFITDRDLGNVHDLLPFLEKFSAAGRNNLVIIARDILGSVLATFIENKLRGSLQVSCIKAPLVGAKQSEFLQDIAILTGATFFSEASAKLIKDATPEDLGYAERVTSTKDATLIVGGKGDQALVEERVTSLRAQLERETSQFEQEKLKERIAKLTSGVAVIRVGGHTEIEMKERKERAIDAVAATQAAIRSGIVPGGEVSYMNALTPGVSPILSAALRKPFDKLMLNAGFDPGEQRSKVDKDKGIDVTDGNVKNLIKAGIIDPVEVPINAINNAVSVAVQLATTEVLIVPEEEDKK